MAVTTGDYGTRVTRKRHTPPRSFVSMTLIERETLPPSRRRWTIVGAALAALFVAAIVILTAHAGAPAPAPAPDRGHAVDNGL